MVDYCLDSLLGGNKLVNELIDFSSDDAEEIALVSCIIMASVPKMLMTSRINRSLESYTPLKQISSDT